MKLYKHIILILVLLLTVLTANSQVVKDTLTVNGDSIKIEKISVELQNYGKQGFLTDKLTLIQFGVVIVGAILSVPAVPILIVTSSLNLIVVAINWKADRRLSQFNKKTEHKFRIHKNRKS